MSIEEYAYEDDNDISWTIYRMQNACFVTYNGIDGSW